MRRRQDERLLEAGLEARAAAGADGRRTFVVAGEGRMSEGALPLAVEHGPLLSDDEAAEHEEPKWDRISPPGLARSPGQCSGMTPGDGSLLRKLHPWVGEHDGAGTGQCSGMTPDASTP